MQETEDKSIFIVPLPDPILSQINGVNISGRVAVVVCRIECVLQCRTRINNKQQPWTGALVGLLSVSLSVCLQLNSYVSKYIKHSQK